jgi:lysosomal alpha-mannosidase
MNFFYYYFALNHLIDRSEGGGSMYDGSIEIMVHRRILHDDSLGVGEALNETAYGKGLVVSGKHILLIERPEDSARLHRIGAQQLFMHPLATYSLPNTSSYANYSNIYHQSWSALSDVMPLNVHLLTFDQLGPKQYLVRVEHYFELYEDEIYSQPVTFDLQTLFNSIGTISEMIELTLSANLPLSELHRLDWMTKDRESSHVDTFRKLNLIEKYLEYTF